jgi:exoribonuclease R
MARLHAISKMLQKKRADNGALLLSLPDVNIDVRNPDNIRVRLIRSKRLPERLFRK